MAQAIPTDGVTSFGFTKFRPPSAVFAERAANATPAPEESTIVSPLSGYIRKCFESAKQAKQPIEEQMLRNLRMDNGIYEADTLSAIRQMGGSEVYVLLTAKLCRAAETWINDILRPIDDKSFTIQPTPIAELPPDLQQQIMGETQAVYQETLTQIMQAGEQFDLNDIKDEIREYAATMRDKAMQELQEEALRRCARMSTKIEDQFAEGGFHDAQWAFVSDFVRLKAGIIKGPVVRQVKTQQYIQGPQGWSIGAQASLKPTYERVSPFDLYPAPDSRGPDDGFLIERIPLTRKGLWEMIGVPGYSEENIRTVIREYGIGGKREQLPIDAQRALFDFGSTQSLFNSDKMDGLEFWGSVPGSMLIDWGMKEEIDAEMEYEVNAILVGSYVIRAILNPDKLGRKPYSVDSYHRVPGSFWGKGVPELMADSQHQANVAARAIANNAMLASGPIVEVNSERCSDNEKLYPWKIFQSTNSQMLEAPAVRFYTTPIVTQALLAVFEFWSTLAEDQTGIPRWAYGNTSVGGAGSTSSGLSMLMTSASRNIKEAIAHIDRVVSGCVSRTYDFNMLYDPDESIKGDAKVIARGSAGFMAKEQKTIRTNEILAATNNPIDSQIMGIPGRAKLLKVALQGLDIPVDDIIPDENGLKEIMAKIEEQQKQQMMLMQQQAAAKGASPLGGSPTGMNGPSPGPAPRMLDQAGNPAGGADMQAIGTT